MSRSYKKPWIKDKNKFAQKKAARRIRQTGEVPDGNQYKKFYEPWAITDWSYRAKPDWFKDRIRKWKSDFGNERSKRTPAEKIARFLRNKYRRSLIE